MRKTPQEKKRHSYEKDRRNCYGENSKASRKAIPENKANSRRRIRRASKRQDFESDDYESEVIQARRKAFKKVPDMALGEYLSHKREARKDRE